MRAGTLGAVVRMVILAVVCGAALLSAQSPAPIYDPAVTPAQRLEPPVMVPDSPRPSAGNGVTTAQPRGASAVFDPPPPMLQLSLRTPAAVPVDAPVPYKIVVSNASAAKALKVKVRMPWPDGAAALAKCEPMPEGIKEAKQAQPGKELEWVFGDLSRGAEQKTIELTFTPKPGAKKVSAQAYVNFEYGAKVDTSIDVPKLSVTRTATPQVAVGDLITVQVQVKNTGTVPIPKVKLAESVPPEAEFRGTDDGEKSATVPGLRTFDLGTIGPGQTAKAQYQLLIRQPGNKLTTSTASSGELSVVSDRVESVSKVLQPALKFSLIGPGQVAPKAPARYKATVLNAGTLPLSDVRVAVDIPDGLTVTKQRLGGKQDGNRRVWVIPKLAAGEAEEIEFQAEQPESGLAGKRQFKASAQDGRRLVDTQTAEVTTEFVGRADLRWTPVFHNNAIVGVNRQGTISVTVKNIGAETDKGVRLRVQFPPEVRYKDTAGRTKATFDNAILTFDIQPLAPGKSAEFEIAYEGFKAGQAQFTLLLEGESLSNQPLRKEQSVTVEPR